MSPGYRDDTAIRTYYRMCVILFKGEVEGVSIVKRCIILFILASVIPAVPAFPDYATCYRSRDAYVRSDQPNENFDNNYLYHGRKSADEEYLCYMEFDLSPIPEYAKIEEAYLEFHIATFGGESTGDTYFLMIVDEWTECEVSYCQCPEVADDISAKVEWSRQEWVKTDCTEFVRRWYEGEVDNNGIIGIISEGEKECWYRIYSKEYGDEGTNPRIIVKYEKTNTGGKNSRDGTSNDAEVGVVANAAEGAEGGE